MGFSGNDAKLLETLSRREQYNISSTGCFPSNFSLLSRPVIPTDINWGLNESSTFTTNMKVLKESFQSLLRDVDAEHFCTTSDTTLDDFFVAIKDQPGFSLKMEDTSFAIKLSNMENEISCPIDSYLKFFITSGNHSDISAVYHRCITVSKGFSDYTLILKRKKLKHTYVAGFNPSLSLVTKGKCLVKFIGKEQNKEACVFSKVSKPDLGEDLFNLGVDHEEVTITNLVFLLSRKYKLFLRSNHAVFFNAKFDRHKKFINLRTFDKNKHYLERGTGKYYELTSDLHDQYLDRIGFPDLVFMQFCMWFRPTNDEDESLMTISQETNKAQKIQLVTAVEDCQYLPDKLQLKSGKLLLLQRKPSMCYTHWAILNSEQFVESNIMFYHPHTSLHEVSKELHETIFNQKNKLEKNRTNLEIVRAKLFPNLNENMFNKLFYE